MLNPLGLSGEPVFDPPQKEDYQNIKIKSPVNLAIYRTLLRRERDFIPLYHLL